MRLRGGNHFTWTDVLCAGQQTVANCIANKTEAQLINAYGIAFPDAPLMGQDNSLLRGDGSGLSAYLYQQ